MAELVARDQIKTGHMVFRVSIDGSTVDQDGPFEFIIGDAAESSKPVNINPSTQAMPRLLQSWSCRDFRSFDFCYALFLRPLGAMFNNRTF